MPARASAGGSSRRWTRGTAATPCSRTTSRSPAPRRAPRTACPGRAPSCAPPRRPASWGPAAVRRPPPRRWPPAAWLRPGRPRRPARRPRTRWPPRAGTSSGTHREGRDPQPGADVAADLRGADEGTARRLVASERAGRADHPAVLAGPVATRRHRDRHVRVQQGGPGAQSSREPTGRSRRRDGAHDDHCSRRSARPPADRARRAPTGLSHPNVGVAPGRVSGSPGSTRPP
jgi:hypothetical protein